LLQSGTEVRVFEQPTVLIVAPSPNMAANLYAWVTGAGYQATVVSTFQAARHHLDRSPTLLISEVRLGDYNGLQLAFRAHTRDIPAIVIGEPDTVLERDALQFDAEYLPMDVQREHLLALVLHHTDAARRRASSAAASGVAPLFVSWSDLKNSVADASAFFSPFSPRRRVTAS
jgi:DNA-binding NtrC family response regulator